MERSHRSPVSATASSARLLLVHACGLFLVIAARAQQSVESAPPLEDLLPPPSLAREPEIRPVIIPYAVEPLPADMPSVLPGTPDDELPPPSGLPLPPPSDAAQWDDIGQPPDPEAAASDGESDAEPWPASGASRIGGTPEWFLASGFENGFDMMPLRSMPMGSLRDGLGLGVFLSGTYDSNPSRGYGLAEDTGEGDFYLTLGGSLSYQSKLSVVNYSVNYSGGYSEYFSQSELSRYNQSAGASVSYTYDRGPFMATLTGSMGFGSGTNRYYASLVDVIDFNLAIDSRYRISSKTSLQANLSKGFASASEGANQNTSDFDLGVSAMWSYSPLTEFGPGVRYTRSSGDSGDDRTSIGPMLSFNHELTRKVSLNSRVGADFSDYGDGGYGDPELSGSVGLAYRASRFWGLDLSLSRDVQPSYLTAGQFEAMTALRLNYNRLIRRASWNFGLGWETRSSEGPDAGLPVEPDIDYWTLDTSLGMLLFADTTNAQVFMRLSEQSGGSSAEWDSFQTGFSLSRSF